MRKIDSLDLLRSSYTQKPQKKPPAPPKLKQSYLYFDREKLPIDTETAWISPQTGKQFSLGSLWLYLELHSQRIPNRSQYFKQVSALGLDAVGVADAEEIVRYFTGQAAESVCVNQELRAALLARKGGREKSVAEEGDYLAEQKDKVQKKQKPQSKLDEQTQQLLKNLQYTYIYQKPTNSKSRCMRYPQKTFTSILTHIIDNQPTNAPAKPAQNSGGKLRLALLHEKRKVPVIIVPQRTVPGNVSLGNIEKFLVKGQYDEYAKLDNPDVSKIEIEKVLKQKRVLFEINSRPQLLSQEDWQSVIAVFVIGKDNEFDQWPHKNHKAVFKNCLGYMVKFPKTLIGSASQWKCQPKILDPISRTADKELVREIWRDIENYLYTRV